MNWKPTKGDWVILSQNCRHEYARGELAQVLKVIKARGGEAKVKLGDGRIYWANIDNIVYARVES
jgi:hypothetical protein